MTLILSGTDGLSDVDGTAAAPAIRGTDTNTGIFFPAADTIAFAEGGVEVMRLTSNGDLLLGTTSSTALSTGQLQLGTTSAAGSAIQMLSSTTGSTGLYFGDGTTGDLRYRGAVEYDNNGDSLRFYSSSAERMRIDSSGNLLVGTTTVTTGKLNVVSATAVAGDFYVSGTSLLSTPTLYLEKADNNTTTSNVFVKFTVNATATGSGQINANGANAAAFGAFSDRRLKENITDLPSQLANIMALRPVEYDYIESEGGGHQIGFVAQEVQAVYPDLIGERDDGMLTLSDMNKNDARLIKCIQEQQALITALTTRITALEAANV